MCSFGVEAVDRFAGDDTEHLAGVSVTIDF